MNLINKFDFSSGLDFLRLRRFTLILSSLLIVLSAGFFFTKELNLGVDFKGGILMEVRMTEAADIASLRSGLNTLGVGEVGLQTFGGDTDILITLQRQTAATEQEEAEIQKETIRKIQSALGDPEDSNPRVAEYRRVETVGPTVSDELKGKAFWATIYALIGIGLYIAFRFEWRFALAALAALAHDVITTLGLFSVTGLEFNLTTVAAILTIAGYSINDTVVVFDRAREELRRYKKKATEEILNIALNRTLSRTLMTSLTTLLALFALAAFGGPVIRGLSIALIWGVLIGTYSSLFVAVPLLMFFKVKRSVFDVAEQTGANDAAAAFVQGLADEERENRKFDAAQGPDEEVIPPETSAKRNTARNADRSGRNRKAKRKPKRK